jgi:hypothetical protein
VKEFASVNESNNADMSGKLKRSPLGAGGKKKRMNECSNNGDKTGCSRRWAGQVEKGLFEKHDQKRIVQPVYGGPFVLYNKPQQVVAMANYYVPAQNQQLPIKETSQGLQVPALFKWYSGYNSDLAYSLQTSAPV